MLAFIQDPIIRCSQLCQKLKRSMERFDEKPVTVSRDWTTMKFMGADFNGFIDTIEGYKSTMIVSLGLVMM